MVIDLKKNREFVFKNFNEQVRKLVTEIEFFYQVCLMKCKIFAYNQDQDLKYIITSNYIYILYFKLSSVHQIKKKYNFIVKIKNLCQPMNTPSINLILSKKSFQLATVFCMKEMEIVSKLQISDKNHTPDR